jgi:hypothetical protein
LKKYKKYIEIFLWIGILLILCLPLIQQYFSVFNIEDLDGDFEVAPRVEFSKKTWMNGEYQQKITLYLNDKIGFRPTMIRAKNQIDFSLYRKGNADGITIGKEDWFYEYDYIREFIGADFVGEQIIDRKIRQIKFLQKHLKETQNIDFVLVFEPGKASVYPEFIPDEYQREEGVMTNTQLFLSKVKEYDINHIDLDTYFQKLKKTASYPIYPQYGIHWTEYGAALAADSLLHYIEAIRQIRLAKYNYDSLLITSQPQGTDYDVGKTLNLFFQLPSHQEFAYPVYHFEKDTTADRPRVLVVGDSYYWNIFNTRIPKHLFANEAFWYFNDLVYPDTYSGDKHAYNLNIKEEVEKQDVIFLMVTKRFLYKFDWKFLDQLYYQYVKGLPFNKKLSSYLNGILGYEKWFVDVIEKAKNRNISLEEMLQIEAKYVYFNDYSEEFLFYHGVEYYQDKIKASQEWYEQLIQKAKQKGISLDSMLIYSFQQEFPEIYQKHLTLMRAKNNILMDSTLLFQTNELASKNCCTFEEALLLKAEEYLNK